MEAVYLLSAAADIFALVGMNVAAAAAAAAIGLTITEGLVAWYY